MEKPEQTTVAIAQLPLIRKGFYQTKHVEHKGSESMQLSFDSRGNSVPTILLMMQRHLYARGGLQVWFRELPNGLLDSIPQEEVMQVASEEDCAQLVRRLWPTEAALLDWAINLMAGVAQLEYLNKINAHNVAVVFAPNMTQKWRPAVLGNTLVTKSRGLAYVTLLMITAMRELGMKAISNWIGHTNWIGQKVNKRKNDT